jgi:hypothetical protein
MSDQLSNGCCPEFTKSDARAFVLFATFARACPDRNVQLRFRFGENSDHVRERLLYFAKIPEAGETE